MSFVVDSSVALSWCFDDEHSSDSDAVLDHLTRSGAHAPVLWPLEVLNGLASAERRKRLTSTQRRTLSEFLHRLPVAIDTESIGLAWSDTARLAERYRLTIYDAAYLELALRLALPLATLDQQLAAAAKKAHARIYKPS